MSNIYLIGVMREVLYYIVIAICILAIPTLLVGVMLSIVQAATQINEMTLTFIPKFILMCFLLGLLGPWFIEHLVRITQDYLINLPMYIR